MSVGRKTWLAYAAFQIIGEICQWSWPSAQPAMGPWLWGGAFFLLLPGNLVGGYLIERRLWGTEVTLSQMQVLLALGINLATWASGAWLWRRFAVKIQMGAKRRQTHLS